MEVYQLRIALLQIRETGHNIKAAAVIRIAIQRNNTKTARAVTLHGPELL